MLGFETGEGNDSCIAHVADVTALRKGDQKAYFQVCKSYRYVLRTYFASRGFCCSELDDLVQRVFIRLFKVRRKLDHTKGTIHSYVFGIARKILLEAKYEKKRASIRRLMLVQNLKDMDLNNGIDGVIEANELRENIEQQIKELPSRQREVITLVHLHALTSSAAAKKLGISVETLLRTERRALRRIKKQIQQKKMKKTL